MKMTSSSRMGTSPQLSATEHTTGPSRGLCTGEKIKMGAEWLK